jgi:hypothetical protein
LRFNLALNPGLLPCGPQLHPPTRSAGCTPSRMNAPWPQRSSGCPAPACIAWRPGKPALSLGSPPSFLILVLGPFGVDSLSVGARARGVLPLLPLLPLGEYPLASAVSAVRDPPLRFALTVAPTVCHGSLLGAARTCGAGSLPTRLPSRSCALLVSGCRMNVQPTRR